MPKVTIAIAAYNREQYLKECLQSIANQTFKDFEVIVFDNGSEYNVRSLVDSFTNIKITLERVGQNIGQDANFLRIYKYNYNTPYIIVFHDDDTMHPLLLEEEVKLLDSDSEIKWVGSSFSFVSNHLLMNKFSELDLGKTQGVYNKGGLTREILKGFTLCFDSIMYRKGVFGDHLSLVDKFSKWSDRPQVITWAGDGKVGLIKAPLVNFRLHINQDSAKPMDKKTYLTFAKNLFTFYKDNLPTPLSRSDLKIWYRHNTNNLILSIANNSESFKDFLKTLNEFIPEYFKWQYLRPKGVYYLLKTFKKFYL